MSLTTNFEVDCIHVPPLILSETAVVQVTAVNSFVRICHIFQNQRECGVIVDVLDTRWQVRMVASKVQVVGIKKSMVLVCEGTMKSQSGPRSDEFVPRVNLCEVTARTCSLHSIASVVKVDEMPHKFIARYNIVSWN